MVPGWVGDGTWMVSCKLNIYVSWSTSEWGVRLAPWNWLESSTEIFLLTVPGRASFVDGLFVSCVCCAFAHCCLVIVCWERADLLALVCGVKQLVVVLSLFRVVSWILIVLIPDLRHLSYFQVTISNTSLLEGAV